MLKALPFNIYRKIATFTLFYCVVIASVGIAQNFSPKYEVRAVWISTASGDWPKTTKSEEQQRTLVEIFDVLKQNKFNTVFFQVRPRGNVYYQSDIEPWASHLTGMTGKDPGWDPLQFAIDEARKRGLELHAWFNVAKVWGLDPPPSHPKHLFQTHREWLKKVEGEWWIDLGIPEAREYTTTVVAELIQRYDVDGIHFDFIRYPNDKFDDWVSFTQYSDGAERSEWRRNNITAFVRSSYELIQKEKPWIKVGSAPLGIYQPIAGAQSSFNGFSGVFQDSRLWLREGIHDYIAPQLYWSIGEQRNPNDPDFEALSNDWTRENFGRHVYIGIGAYRENVQREIAEQIMITRNEFAHGHAFFRYENIPPILSHLENLYKTPALIPPMQWKDSVPPNSPRNIITAKGNGFTELRWSEPELSSDKERPQRYVIYRSSAKNINVMKAENILAIIPASQKVYRDETTNGKEYFYTVTAVDKVGNESGNAGKTISEIQSLLSRYINPRAEIRLSQNFPNPVSDKTYISIEIPRQSMVTLSLKHSTAIQETVIVQQIKEAGTHIFTIDTKNFPSGLVEYFLTTENRRLSKSFEKKQSDR